MATQIEHGLSGPTVEPILSIHRGADSFVTFHKMQDVIIEGKKKKQVLRDCCVRVESLRDVFPQFVAEFAADDGTDSYFSINGFFRPGTGLWWKSVGQPRAFRKKTNVRYLNGAFCDIDGYNVGLDFGAVVGRLISLQDARVIPPVSIYGRSGKGAWAVWKLVDERDRHVPPTAHAHRIVLWDAIQKELADRIAHLGVDLGAKDLCRIARVPGSFNPKTHTRVAYIMQFAADGGEFEYTLQELATFLGVKTRMPSASDPSPSKSRDAARRRDQGYALRLEDFLRLRHMRGHFSDGCRNFAALTYSWLLHKNRYDADSIRNEITRLAKECDPPLTHDRIDAAVDQGRRIKAMRDMTIATRLRVTPAEANEIYRFDAMPIGIPRVKVTLSERRRLILGLATDRNPALRDIQVALARKGISVGKTTLFRDLRALSGPRHPASTQADLIPRGVRASVA
jgi:hypothetical protein